MYHTCIFDLYGTLIDIHTDEDQMVLWEKLALFLSYYGVFYSAVELQEVYLKIVREMQSGKDLLRNDKHEAYPEIQIEQVFLKIFQRKQVEVGLDLAVLVGQFFRVLSTEYIKLYKGTISMLEELKRAGKHLYLLSNAQRIFALYEMKALGIEEYFEGILISSDFAYKKPDSRFFEELIGRYKIERDTAIMIGNDGVCDIMGARKAGLHTLYVHSNLSPKKEQVQADYVLERMDMKKIGEILLGKSERFI
ncbi:MAG: HAD family hydrolase [Lachnospiraceae bacterium]|nr:HAD family hydrolase [Lachnospiraceae bacterium]